MLENIFSQPQKIDGIELYPVKMKNYNEFMDLSYLFTMSPTRLIVQAKEQQLNIDYDNISPFELFSMTIDFVDDMIAVLKILTNKEFIFKKNL